MTDGQALPIKPAATVALIRGGESGIETLLLRRNKALAFAGGAWVFPGGAVDPADLDQGEGDLERAARIAACREAQEECGLLVQEDQLYQVSHWTTPEGEPRRFSTWLFVAALTDHSTVSIDDGEIHEARWLSLQEVFAQHHAGELPMLPPTYMTLQALEKFSTVDQALAAVRVATPVVVEPHGVALSDGFAALYPGDAGYDSWDAEVAGPRHRTEIRAGIVRTLVADLSPEIPRLDLIG